MNKGIKISKGDYLLFLNSDDGIDNNFFTNVSIKLNEKSVDILYSNIIYSKKNSIFSRKYVTGDKSNIYKLGFHYLILDLIKREYLYNFGLYDTTYRIAADFDFFMKAKTKPYKILLQ